MKTVADGNGPAYASRLLPIASPLPKARSKNLANYASANSFDNVAPLLCSLNQGRGQVLPQADQVFKSGLNGGTVKP